MLLLMLSWHTGHFYSLGQACFAGDAAAPLEPAVARRQLLDHLPPDLEEKEQKLKSQLPNLL